MYFEVIYLHIVYIFHKVSFWRRTQTLGRLFSKMYPICYYCSSLTIKSVNPVNACLVVFPLMWMTSGKVYTMRIEKNGGRVEAKTHQQSIPLLLQLPCTPLPHRYTLVRFLQTFLRFICYKTYTCKHEHALIHIHVRSCTNTMSERASQESFNRRTRGAGTRRGGNEDRQTERTYRRKGQKLSI